MDILEKIIVHKRKEVSRQKELIPVSILEKTCAFERRTLSLMDSLLNPDKLPIIAEFKRKSPSKGIINDKADIKMVTTSYAMAGAAGLSVLTDEEFFGGSSKDLIAARAANHIPILRKEFVVEEYQIIEAKAIGADAILLIAACLTTNETLELSKFANTLGLEVLLELHGEDELQHVNPYVHMVGINNRNLKTFEVSLQHSIDMRKHFEDDYVFISESGLSKAEDIIMLKNEGFDGFLMGEHFMKEENPGLAFLEFANQLQ